MYVLYVCMYVCMYVWYVCMSGMYSQESDGGANTYGRQFSRPASGDVKILLTACNLIEI